MPKPVAPLEEWRPVRGFPKFEVNRNGEVRKRNTKQLVSWYLSNFEGTWYPAVMLSHLGVERRVWLFNIVAGSFKSLGTK